MSKLVELLQLPSTRGFVDETHLAHEGASIYKPFFRLVPRILAASATPIIREYDDGDIEKAAARIASGYSGNLITIFNKSYEESIEYLRHERILSRIVKKEINTGERYRLEVPPDSEESENEERNLEIDRSMAAFTDSNRRRFAIANAVAPDLKRAKDPRVLSFDSTIQGAQLSAITWRTLGFRAQSISGETSKPARQRILRAFRSGEIEILCNCQLLTTGFDDPKISHLIMARPTISRALYEQMLGRGLRGPAFGGTEECVVYEVRDEFLGNGGVRLRYNGELLPKAVWKLISRRF